MTDLVGCLLREQGIEPQLGCWEQMNLAGGRGSGAAGLLRTGNGQMVVLEELDPHSTQLDGEEEQGRRRRDCL